MAEKSKAMFAAFYLILYLVPVNLTLKIPDVSI